MNSVAIKAEKFAKAVALEPEDFESHFRDNRRRIVAYAWEIVHVVGKCEERVAYEFACACLRANRTRTAETILEVLSMSDNRTSDYVVSAKRRTARLAWKAGNHETAIMNLRSVRGRAARNQYRDWVGLMTIRNGLLLGERGDEESARAVLMGGLLASGMNRSAAQEVTAIYLKATCRTSVKAQHAVTPLEGTSVPSLIQGPTPIIISGFGWSGSGAVTDYLKGHPQVADVFSGREVGLWTGKYGLDRIYAHFTSIGFSRRLLLEFLTRHCFGHMFLANSKGTKSLGGLWNWIDEGQQGLLLEALAEWLEALQRWQKNPVNPLLGTFQNFSSRLLRLLVKEESACVLLSNCVPSDAIVAIRMFEAPAVIVSWRDPGDAYASKKAAFPDNSLEFLGWKEQLMRRINNYLSGKKSVADNAKLWIDLSFEEFVQSEQLRQQLLILLDLHGQPMDSSFDPTISARNIGIFRPLAGKDRAPWSALASVVDSARREAQTISPEFHDTDLHHLSQ
jgi:hypothetical protein